MIIIKLFGGAKKTFPNYTPRRSEMTISELLNDMVQSIQPDTSIPDTKNILIAVNGVDSSALNGRDTIIRDGDAVSIIPVIHGGSNHLWFDIPPYTILAFCARTDSIHLDTMRRTYTTLHIQAINPEYVISEAHLGRILEISITSEKNQDILSNNLETDIIQRFAGTTQISQAIQTAGTAATHTCFIIALGEPDTLRQLLYNTERIDMKFSTNKKMLCQTFDFTSSHQSAGYNLEDILIERASVLRQ